MVGVFDSMHLNSAASLIRRRVGDIRQIFFQIYNGFLAIMNTFPPNDTVQLMANV
jgi:hypothetical protein